MKMHVVAEFGVEYRAEVDEKLNAAVEAAFADSSVDGTHGILVTRHDFDHFFVVLSPDVPFGHIQERDYARRN